MILIFVRLDMTLISLLVLMALNRLSKEKKLKLEIKRKEEVNFGWLLQIKNLIKE